MLWLKWHWTIEHSSQMLLCCAPICCVCVLFVSLFVYLVKYCKDEGMSYCEDFKFVKLNVLHVVLHTYLVLCLISVNCEIQQPQYLKCFTVFNLLLTTGPRPLWFLCVEILDKLSIWYWKLYGSLPATCSQTCCYNH